MSRFITDPRRATRVPVELPVELSYESKSWKTVAVDLGPGGCQLGSGAGLTERARIVLTLRSSALPDALTVSATIAWARGGRCGVAFVTGHRGADPRDWFERLLAADPKLTHHATRVPTWLDLEARVSKATPLETAKPLSADERRLLSLVQEQTPAHVLALHAKLPPHYFARALFGLLSKGVVVVPRPAATSAANAKNVAPRMASMKR